MKTITIIIFYLLSIEKGFSQSILDSAKKYYYENVLDLQRFGGEYQTVFGNKIDSICNTNITICILEKSGCHSRTNILLFDSKTSKILQKKDIKEMNKLILQCPKLLSKIDKAFIHLVLMGEMLSGIYFNKNDSILLYSSSIFLKYVYKNEFKYNNFEVRGNEYARNKIVIRMHSFLYNRYIKYTFYFNRNDIVKVKEEFAL